MIKPIMSVTRGGVTIEVELEQLPITEAVSSILKDVWKEDSEIQMIYESLDFSVQKGVASVIYMARSERQIKDFTEKLLNAAYAPLTVQIDDAFGF